ncbi:MAG: SDR family NAD(P)-dependent oxidoreductase [Bacteroidetes bacterium]|nr:SDR family NAD(P)-dependent oxidoreductase [Bacteroidota bacterium]
MKKTIFITGATSGIGKATAELFAQQGHRLVLCGRRVEILKQLKNQFSDNEVYWLQFDVRHADQVHQAIQSLPLEWQNIDVLINNAGNAHGLEPISEGKISDWDAMLDGNVKGLLYVSQPIIQWMKARKTGHIVNISSVAARQTYANGVVYCASKKAVDILSEGMRIELTEFGIKVTNIQPGAVETDFSKIRFKGDEIRANTVYQGYEALKAEDIANAISYCVNAPERVSIAEICIYPKAQAEPRMIHKE